MAATDGAIFTNVEDFVGALQEARTELVVTGPGVFWARLTRVVLPHLNLLAVSESLQRTAYITWRPERACVAFPVRTDSSSVWGGVRLQRGHLVFHSRGERLHQRTNGGLGETPSLVPADGYGRPAHRMALSQERMAIVSGSLGGA